MAHEEHHAGGHEQPHQDLLVFILSLILAVLTLYVTTRLQVLRSLPFTVAMFLEGLVLFEIHDLVDMGILSKSINSWINVDPHLLLFGALPVLIFPEAMFSSRNFFLVLPGCLLLAVPGVLIGTYLTALVLFYVLPFGLNWSLSLTAGAILSATDPVAVVALLEDLGASPKMTALISGESLLNDGVALVLFKLFFDKYQGKESEPLEIAIELVRVSIGGPAFGALVGITTMYIIYQARRRASRRDKLIHLITTLFAAYVAFFVGEELLGVSGVLSSLACGLVYGTYSNSILHEPETIHGVWHAAGGVVNATIFFLSGLLSAQALTAGSFAASFFGYILLLWAFCILIRVTMLLLLYPFLFLLLEEKASAENGPRGVRATIAMTLRTLMQAYVALWAKKTKNYKEVAVMTWGGLRGAVGLALAILLRNDLDSLGESEDGNKIVAMVSGVAALTLLINATTSEHLLSILGMKGMSSAERQVLQVLEVHVMDETIAPLQELLETYQKYLSKDSSTPYVEKVAALEFFDYIADAVVHGEYSRTKYEEESKFSMMSDSRTGRSGRKGGRIVPSLSLSWINNVGAVKRILSSDSLISNPYITTTMGMTDYPGKCFDVVFELREEDFSVTRNRKARQKAKSNNQQHCEHTWTKRKLLHTFRKRFWAEMVGSPMTADYASDYESWISRSMNAVGNGGRRKGGRKDSKAIRSKVFQGSMAMFIGQDIELFDEEDSDEHSEEGDFWPTRLKSKSSKKLLGGVPSGHSSGNISSKSRRRTVPMKRGTRPMQSPQGIMEEENEDEDGDGDEQKVRKGDDDEEEEEEWPPGGLSGGISSGTSGSTLRRHTVADSYTQRLPSLLPVTVSSNSDVSSRDSRSFGAEDAAPTDERRGSKFSALFKLASSAQGKKEASNKASVHEGNSPSSSSSAQRRHSDSSYHPFAGIMAQIKMKRRLRDIERNRMLRAMESPLSLHLGTHGETFEQELGVHRKIYAQVLKNQYNILQSQGIIPRSGSVPIIINRSVDHLRTHPYKALSDIEQVVLPALRLDDKNSSPPGGLGQDSNNGIIFGAPHSLSGTLEYFPQWILIPLFCIAAFFSRCWRGIWSQIQRLVEATGVWKKGHHNWLKSYFDFLFQGKPTPLQKFHCLNAVWLAHSMAVQLLQTEHSSSPAVRRLLEESLRQVRTANRELNKLFALEYEPQWAKHAIFNLLGIAVIQRQAQELDKMIEHGLVLHEEASCLHSLLDDLVDDLSLQGLVLNEGVPAPRDDRKRKNQVRATQSVAKLLKVQPL